MTWSDSVPEALLRGVFRIALFTLLCYWSGWLK
jgi:hypothetical protein